MKNFTLNFLGIGAKKSATSWLSKCISEHPEVCIPSQKEIHFFSQNKKFEKGLEFYESFFNVCKKLKKKGEFSTSYFTSEETPKRVKALLPDIKLILILRDPTERAVSHFKHLISKKRAERGEKIEDVIKKFSGIVSVGMYAKHIKRWFSVFEREQILVLFYEEIKQNPKDVLRRTFDFLNIDNNFIPDSLEKRQNVSSYRLSPLFIYINKIYLKLRKNTLGRLLIEIGRYINISKVLNFFLNRTKKEIKISEEDKMHLRSFFVEDIKELENILGKDLSNWK